MGEKKNNCWKLGIAIILVVLICATIIYIKMPKRVCHTEYRVERIIPTHEYVGVANTDYTLICEEGVRETWIGNRGVWLGWDDYDKICLIKYKEKVCEIV